MFQNEEKITTHQALMLILAGGIGNTYTAFVIPVVKDAGRDAWLSVLMAYALAMVLGLVLINLGLRFPDKTFIQYLPIVLGKFIGKLIGFAYLLCWLIINPIIIKNFMNLISFFLPTTPSIVIGIFMYVLVVYAAYQGFQVYARTAEFFVLVIITSIFLLIIGIIPNVDYGNLKPFLENGLSPLTKSLIIQFPFASETILFMALWFPSMSNMKDGKKALFIGIPIAGLTLTLLLATIIAFTGTEMIINLTYPFFYMTRYIHISDVIAGFDAIFMLLWVSSFYLQILVFFYPFVVGLAQWLKLKDYKPLIIPTAVINIAIASLPINIVQTQLLDVQKNPYIIMPMALLLIAVWLIAMIRKLDESKK